MRKMLQKVEADNKKFQKMLDGIGSKNTGLSKMQVETEEQRAFKKRMLQRQREYEKEQRELDQKIRMLDQKLEKIEKENEKLVFVPHS